MLSRDEHLARATDYQRRSAAAYRWAMSDRECGNHVSWTLLSDRAAWLADKARFHLDRATTLPE